MHRQNLFHPHDVKYDHLKLRIEKKPSKRIYGTQEKSAYERIPQRYAQRWQEDGHEKKGQKEIVMDAKIRKVERQVSKTGKQLKSLEKADKKRDKFVDAGKKAMHKKGARGC